VGVDIQQVAGVPVEDDQRVGERTHCCEAYRKGVVVPVEDITNDRRRHTRWDVGGQLEGRVTATRKRAQVVDISRGGALVEHLNIVPPQTISFVILFFPTNDLRLKCRAVRSAAHRYEVWPSGERGWVYRTGLEFLEARGASPRVIEEYLPDGDIDAPLSEAWIAKEFGGIP